MKIQVDSQLKKIRPLLLCLTACAITAGTANATVVLSDDFESYTANAALPTTDWDVRTTVPAATYTILNSSEFGSPNQFVDFDDNTGSGFGNMIHKTSLAGGGAYTFSLDFIHTTSGSGIQFGFSAGADVGTALGSDTIARVSLNDGDITGTNSSSGFGTGFFNLNDAYELKMVLNDSGSNIDYAGRSLADNAYDVWIRDLTDSGSTYVGTGTFTTSTQYYTAARSFNSPTPTTYIDNWLVETGAVVTPIPEPGTLMLLGLGAFVMLRRQS